MLEIMLAIILAPFAVCAAIFTVAVGVSAVKYMFKGKSKKSAESCEQ